MLTEGTLEIKNKKPTVLQDIMSHFLSVAASLGILELYADSIFVGYTHELTWTVNTFWMFVGL